MRKWRFARPIPRKPKWGLIAETPDRTLMSSLSDFAGFPRKLNALVNNAVPARAFVRRVTDADSITVDLDRRFHDGSLKRIRLKGINAPELNTEAGKAGRIALSELLPIGTPVVVTTFKATFDRYSGDVWFLKKGEVTNLADQMVALGHAEYV